MGMFDEVRIDKSLLPEPFCSGSELEFQTKGLENQLHTYTITKDGLFKKDFSTGEVTRLSDITTEFSFYADYCPLGNGPQGRVEFVARYKEGQLTHLHRRFQTDNLMDYYRLILAGAGTNKN